MGSLHWSPNASRLTVCNDAYTIVKVYAGLQGLATITVECIIETVKLEFIGEGKGYKQSYTPGVKGGIHSLSHPRELHGESLHDPSPPGAVDAPVMEVYTGIVEEAAIKE